MRQHSITLASLASSGLCILLALIPSDLNAAALGEPLAIIVHKNSPVDSVTSDDLRKFCLREKRHWSNNRKVTIVLREPGQTERVAILHQVYGMNESEFKRHFLQATFTGELQGAPKELSTGLGVRRFVFNVPGALGFVRMSDVDSSVKILKLDGLAPTNSAYRLIVAPNQVGDLKQLNSLP